MPMLKTAAAGTTSVTGVKRYLEKQQKSELDQYRREWALYEEGQAQLTQQQAGYVNDYLTANSRSLAIDVSDDLEPGNWARQMDLTRVLYGHDKPGVFHRGRANRTYYHFILSPAPEDAVTLSTMRAYARDWAEANFRRDGKKHEYAIVYHDDNTKGLLHAHLIVNVSNHINGRKLQLNNDAVVKLQVSAQEIGKRYGLTPLREQMQHTIGARTTQPVYMDKAEREIRAKGGRSWKAETRHKIIQCALASSGFDGFKRRLNREGYDVVKNSKTGYLTYIHPNGKKVKDSKLGAYFYLESLEQMFVREEYHDERTYTEWELMKITKGELPWKEEVRRAVDAIAPTVLTIPELQEELRERYGIRMIFNRCGITYQLPNGYKVRDVGIGMRYTPEGLQHNAAVAWAEQQPDASELNRAVEQFARSVSSSAEPSPASDLGALLLYRDVSQLMNRRGLSSEGELKDALEREREELREEKGELAQLRTEVQDWNRLAALQKRRDEDRSWLESDEGRAAEPLLYNEVLMRFEGTDRYLREQTGGADAFEMQAQLNQKYEERLEPYQSRLGQLHKDQSLYQNYLIIKSVSFGFQPPREPGGSIGANSFFAASRILESWGVRNMTQLDELIASKERALMPLEGRMHMSEKELKQLELICSFIRLYRETSAQMPQAPALESRIDQLLLEAQQKLLSWAKGHLGDAGVREEDHDAYLQALQEAQLGYGDATDELTVLKEDLAQLNYARSVSRSIADTLMSPQSLQSSAPKFQELPIAEAKRKAAEKNAERAKQAARRKEELQR